ncbi:MAG: hypothetical protein ACLUUG_12905 [Lachnospiraceae bacterium]
MIAEAEIFVHHLFHAFCLSSFFNYNFINALPLKILQYALPSLRPENEWSHRLLQLVTTTFATLKIWSMGPLAVCGYV